MAVDGASIGAPEWAFAGPTFDVGPEWLAVSAGRDPGEKRQTLG